MAKHPSKKNVEKLRKKALGHAKKAQEAWSEESRSFPKKIREWKKVLKDDWDSEPEDILIVLKYKLERTRKQLVQNDLTATTKKMERQILAVEKLLDAVIKNDYLEKFSKTHREKYGRVKMKTKPVEGADYLVEAVFYYPKAKTKRQQDAAHRQMNKIHKRADKAREDDLKKAFDLLRRDIWGWWD